MDLIYGFNQGAGNNGNVLFVDNSLNSGRNQSFTYDQLNRLLSAQTNNQSGTDCFGLTYVYDSWGNLTSTPGITGFSGCTQSNLNVIVNGNNQIIESGFVYDASGNLLSDGINSYAWDGEGQMKSADGVNYVYDGDGNRVMKTGSKIYWYGLSGEPLAESDTMGNFTDDYIFFAGSRVVHHTRGHNALYYYLPDHLGTPRTIVAATGVVCYDADFTPFGAQLALTNNCAQNYKFTAKERDSESNLDNFGARYDSSQYGRFMSPDEPFYSGRLDNPQDLNLYSYVRNNPVTNVDPDGHDVRVCVDNGNGGQNCVNLTDQQYANLYKQQNNQQGINLPGGQFPGGNITCNGGQVCGSAKYFEPGLQPDYLGDALIGGFAGGIVNAGRAFFEGLFGSAARDTTAGVIAGETTRPGEATVQDILQGAVKEGGSRADIYAKPGGLAQATKDFDALGGQAQNLGRVQIKDLPNGAGRAVLRDFSSNGRATLEIQPAGGGYKSVAIRYNP